jgi:glycosyltransferase involved in cell wall biosynthesis
VTPLRVGVICDLREEGWHSMDLIAEMLLDSLPSVAGREIVATGLRPQMVPRWSRLPLIGHGARARLGDRLTGRLWDYPRWLAPYVPAFDVFHIVDHSYAHLVGILPPERTVVTCNDLDAIRPALAGASRFDPARLLASPVLAGLRRAAHIACISEATRAELIATGCVEREQVSVVPLGVHPSCSPMPVHRADAEIDQLLGPRRREILHVGSTIPRKRIDVLLQVLRGVREVIPELRLVHVGGPLTRSQRALAAALGVSDAIVELPYLERPVLAALYRRAAILVLPSDREGFGLPVAEAMACGMPVVASAIPSLQETGSDGAVYCPPGNPTLWVPSIIELLREERACPLAWEARRRRSIAAASRFDWKRYAAGMSRLYRNSFQLTAHAS